MIFLLTLSAMLLYSKSKYFPRQLSEWFRFPQKYPATFRIVAYAITAVALWLSVAQYGGITGFLIWLHGLMLVFGVIIVCTPIIYKS